MNEFIKLDDPSQGIYELSAVLIHCGLSAFSGHYVAHILDKKVNMQNSFTNGFTKWLATS